MELKDKADTGENGWQKKYDGVCFCNGITRGIHDYVFSYIFSEILGFILLTLSYARVGELEDPLVSEASSRKGVMVQVHSCAPKLETCRTGWPCIKFPFGQQQPIVEASI